MMSELADKTQGGQGSDGNGQATCSCCGRPYSPSDEANDHYWDSPHWYSSGANRFCLACWLMVGPNDMNADPFYDGETAVCFTASVAGVSQDTSRCILAARDRYHFGLGISESVPGENVERAALQKKHPDLFPAANIANRYVADRFEREFVVRETGLDEGAVSRVLRADLLYLQSLGIIEHVPSERSLQ